MFLGAFRRAFPASLLDVMVRSMGEGPRDHYSPRCHSPGLLANTDNA